MKFLKNLYCAKLSANVFILMKITTIINEYTSFVMIRNRKIETYDALSLTEDDVVSVTAAKIRIHMYIKLYVN